MRILHTSDLHIGKSLYEFSLLEDQAHLLLQLKELIIAQHIDAVLIAGDIYDRPVPSGEAMALFDHFLEQIVVDRKIPVYAIAGNHDGAVRLEFGNRMYEHSGYHIVGTPTLDIPILPLSDTVSVWLLPYLHHADVRTLLNDPSIRTFDAAYQALLAHNRPRVSKNRVNILVGHGFFSAIQSSTSEELHAITSDSEINIGGIDIASSAVFSAYDYVALGHLHAPQWVEPGRIRYSGSPLKYSLSEQSQRKSVTILEIENSTLATTEIPIIPLRDVRTIYGTLPALLDPSFHAIHPTHSFSDYVFAEIKGQEEAFAMEKLRVLFPNLLGLVFVDNLVQSMPTFSKNRQRQKQSLQTLFAEFYETMKDEPLPEAHQRIVNKIVQELEDAT